MKQLLKFTAIILLTSTLFFVACKKEKAVTIVVISPPLPLPPPSKTDTSVTGKEFIFKDLVWDFDSDGAANLYLGIENRSDLFGNNVVAAVYLQSDPDTNWIAAEIFHYPNSPGYVYGVYSNSLFVFHSPHIFPWSDNNHLAGTKVSIKVKLL